MNLTGKNSICFVMDLGGVLVQLAGQNYFSSWIEYKLPEHRIKNFWHECSTLIDHYERGACTTNQFVRNLVEKYKLPFSHTEIIEVYRDFVIAAMPGARRLLLELRHHGKLACLSNTSSVHWRKIEEEMNLLDCFDYLLPSHWMKFRKPEHNAYTLLLETLQLDPDKIFFFDDSEANVKAARSRGITAFQVEGVKGVRTALSNILF